MRIFQLLCHEFLKIVTNKDRDTLKVDRIIENIFA